VTDTLGNMLEGVVHGADVHDRDGDRIDVSEVMIYAAMTSSLFRHIAHPRVSK